MKTSEKDSGVIYTAKCVRCGRMTHRNEPFVDGTAIEHASTSVDHNGLTASYACHGVFVSIMGRTVEESRSIAAEYRSRQRRLIG